LINLLLSTNADAFFPFKSNIKLMKLMSHGRPFVLIVFAALFLISCSKDGATGPAGAAGPGGPAGPTGPAGGKGDPGTANVIYSAWLDVTFTKDAPPPNVDTTFYATIAAQKLDKNILTTGDVKLFMNFNTADDPVIVSIPYFDGGVIINQVAYIGGIDISSNVNAGTGRDENNAKVLQYRYVLIPGGTAARQAAGIDWNDYKQVKKYLNLQD
jgi:hypothetical protein